MEDIDKAKKEIKDIIFFLDQRIEKETTLRRLYTDLLTAIENEPKNNEEAFKRSILLASIGSQITIVTAKPIMKKKMDTGGIVGESNDEFIIKQNK